MERMRGGGLNIFISGRFTLIVDDVALNNLPHPMKDTVIVFLAFVREGIMFKRLIMRSTQAMFLLSCSVITFHFSLSVFF